MVIKIRILVITTNKNHPKADTNVSVRGATSVVFCGASEDLRFLAGAVDLAGETKILFTLGHSHNDSGVRDERFVELAQQHRSLFTLGIWVNRCP